MTENERTEFLERYFATLQAEVYGNIQKMPDNWGGFELREYVLEVAMRHAPNVDIPDHSRHQSFVNDLLVRNL